MRVLVPVRCCVVVVVHCGVCVYSAHAKLSRGVNGYFVGKSFARLLQRRKRACVCAIFQCDSVFV